MADNKQRTLESDQIPEPASQSPEQASECELIEHNYTLDPEDQDLTNQEKAAKLKIIDEQFNRKMKELFAQPTSGQLVPCTIIATLQETSNYLLQHLGKFHTLAWIFQFKSASEQGEISF